MRRRPPQHPPSDRDHDRTEGGHTPGRGPGAQDAARPVPPLGAGFPPARPLGPAGPRASGTHGPTEGQGGGPWAAGRSSEGSPRAEAPFPAPRHGPGRRSELEFRGVGRAAGGAGGRGDRVSCRGRARPGVGGGGRRGPGEPGAGTEDLASRPSRVRDRGPGVEGRGPGSWPSGVRGRGSGSGIWGQASRPWGVRGRGRGPGESAVGGPRSAVGVGVGSPPRTRRPARRQPGRRRNLREGSGPLWRHCLLAEPSAGAE